MRKVLVALAAVGVLLVAAPAYAAWNGTIAGLTPQYVQGHTISVQTCAPDWLPWDWDHQSCTTKTELVLPNGQPVTYPGKPSAALEGYYCYYENITPGVDGCPKGVVGFWERVKAGMGL